MSYFAILIAALPLYCQEPQAADRQTRIPNRSTSSLFKSKQGQQRTEIHFDPARNLVTIKLLVQDPNGSFVSNIHPNNFFVYEDGVRQKINSVEVEHAPASISLLLEGGGRSQALNRMLGPEIARTGQQLLSAITKDDQVAVWKYTDKIEKVSDFTRDKDRLESIFYSLRETAFSETNLYDAVIFAVGLMRPVPGRKAVLLVSSGVDTFSKASLEDAQRTVEQGDTPIYVISMVPLARQFTEMSAAPASRIDWNKAELGLEKIAEVSGGRAYAPEGPTDLSGAYDDIMENLKIRYVVRYHSSSTRDPNQPRTVKIDLVDPDTGKPLTIVNSSGRNVRAHLVVQDRYIPTVAAQH